MIQLAGTLIIEDGNALLMRNSNKRWTVPGDEIEDGETPTQASVRSAQEEIDSEISLDKPFYSGEFQKDDKLYEWHCYLATIKEGQPELEDSDEFPQMKWFSKEELEACDKLAPEIRMIEHGLKRLLK